MLFYRYCGERPSLSLTSTSNELTIVFHSDKSHTDKGFSAEYSAYDPGNRKFNACLSHIYTQYLVRLDECDGDSHRASLQSKTGSNCVVWKTQRQTVI